MSSSDLDLLRAKLILACKHTVPPPIYERVSRERPGALTEPWFNGRPHTRRKRVARNTRPARAVRHASFASLKLQSRISGWSGSGGTRRESIDLTDLDGEGERMEDEDEEEGEEERIEEDQVRYVVLDSRTWELRRVRGREEARGVANNPGIEAGREVRLYLNDRMHRFLVHGLTVMRDKRRGYELAGMPRLKGIHSTFKAKARAERDVLGLKEDVKEGSSLYYHLCAAIERMRGEELGAGEVEVRGKDGGADVVAKNSNAELETDGLKRSVHEQLAGLSDDTPENNTPRPSLEEPEEAGASAGLKPLGSNELARADAVKEEITGDMVIVSSDGSEEIIQGADDYAYSLALAEQLQREEDEGLLVEDEERKYAAVHERAVEIRGQIERRGKILWF